MAIKDPVFKVTADGITAPAYDEILEYFKERARSIFGSDINLDADTQDGQLLAVFALALHDVNSQAIALYGCYNPSTAIGAALDVAVKTNGLKRHEASKSTVDLRIVGQAGTIIKNGVALDSSDQKWLLPEEVVIPLSGEITVTAEASIAGAVYAPAHSVSRIGTPTLGWQTVGNASPAAIGAAVESDLALRERQTKSTMQPTIGLWDGMLSAVSQLDDVKSVAGRHNDTNETSLEGIPAHNVALVVEGGDAQEIASTIYRKKSQGAPTFGSTMVEHLDALGTVYQIRFSRPEKVPVTVAIKVSATETWVSTAEADVKQRLADYIDSLPIGEMVDAAKCASVIVSARNGLDDTFRLKELKLNGSVNSVKVAWNKKASCSVDAISVVVE